MKVDPLDGEWFRFHVHSESGKDVYLVDLEELDWNGQCSCPHFTCRLHPKLNVDGKSTHTRCKHILAAREVWFDLVAPSLSTALAKVRQ